MLRKNRRLRGLIGGSQAAAWDVMFGADLEGMAADVRRAQAEDYFSGAQRRALRAPAFAELLAIEEQEARESRRVAAENRGLGSRTLQFREAEMRAEGLNPIRRKLEMWQGEVAEAVAPGAISTPGLAPAVEALRQSIDRNTEALEGRPNLNAHTESN